MYITEPGAGSLFLRVCFGKVRSDARPDQLITFARCRHLAYCDVFYSRDGYQVQCAAVAQRADDNGLGGSLCNAGGASRNHRRFLGSDGGFRRRLTYDFT
jgi:hypothetical protein